MEYRRLGRTDLELPVIAFGAWAIGGWYWGEADDAASIRALREALELGMNAIDTAPVYGFGRSERVIGEALAGRRDGAILMTKVGLRWDDPAGVLQLRTEGPDGRPVQVNRNSRPDSVRLEVERSLARLRTDRIDLIQVHWPDPTTPIAETMGALLELRAAGKVREIGVSNFDLAQLEEAQRALGEVPLASDQPQYSLVARGIEADLLPWARARRVGLLVYSPLEQGLLTGKVTAERRFPPGDGRAKRPTFRPENQRRVLRLLEEVVVPIARAHAATVAQVVLAWTVAQVGITSALVGARDAQQVRSNSLAGGIDLSEEEWSSIDRAFAALELDLAPRRSVRGRVAGLLRRLRG